MQYRPRILVVDTDNKRAMERNVKKVCEAGQRIHVMTALNWESFERLLWRGGRTWYLKKIKVQRRLDCAIINGNADLRDENGIAHTSIPLAMMLAENRVPVLMHSPAHKNQKVRQIQDGCANHPNITAFETTVVPSVAKLCVIDKTTAIRMMAVIKFARMGGGKTMEAQKSLTKMLKKMKADTRDLCLRILQFESAEIQEMIKKMSTA